MATMFMLEYEIPMLQGNAIPKESHYLNMKMQILLLLAIEINCKHQIYDTDYKEVMRETCSQQ